ncbi:MAG TPA: hypothetical protein PK813_01770 [Candidatus Hydrogenedens sp.]|nr:hypothetical protein [Candidatus Hydrogenedens sp.]
MTIFKTNLSKITLFYVLCFLLFTLPAYVLDIEAEAIFVKITKAFDSEVDPDVLDEDKNGIPDRAHARLLDRVLRDDKVPNHDFLLATYYYNWIQIKKDNTLGSRCTAIYQLYGISCDEIERFSAAIITLGEPLSIQYFVQGALSEFGIKLDLKNYNLNGGLYLRGTADLDGDKISNKKEYQLAEGDFNLFVEYAITPGENPVEGELEIPSLDKDIPLIITPAVNSLVNFGKVSLKTVMEMEFSAQNIGTKEIPMQIWIIGEPEFWIVGEHEYLIPPQQTVTFKVQFQPRDYNKVSGILVIESYGKRYYVYLGGQGSWLKDLFSGNLDISKLQISPLSIITVLSTIILIVLSVFLGIEETLTSFVEDLLPPVARK